MNIFESKLTLLFTDKQYENQYRSTKYKTIQKYNIIYSTILTILSSLSLILFCLYEIETFNNYDKGFHFSFFDNIISRSTITLAHLILLIICIFNSSTKAQKWVSYLNYYLSFTSFSLLRVFFGRTLKADILIFSLNFNIEILFRLTWFFSGCLDFLDGFMVQLALIVSLYGFFAGEMDLKFHFRFSIYTIIYLFISLISYFYIYEKRKSFFYLKTVEQKKKMYHNILESMNNGFLSIKNMSIKYLNPTMMKLISLITNGEKISNTYKVMESLFKNINTFDENKNNLKIENILSKLEYNFTVLGTISTVINSEEEYRSNINLQVYGRYFKTTEGENFEFIFNDISKIKIIEEANAEFKYKTLFLSKVAHEFKNPLLCITELVDQVIEKFGSNCSYIQILNQIKSLSYYLIILIKDMDFFSQKYINQANNVIETNLFNIDETLKFCKDITISLIKKFNKNIQFKLIIEENVPSRICSDELKLKQILINLLSNSVKYTMSGCITLTVKNDDDNNNKIRFTVSDTGRGISDNIKNRLFKPFIKDIKNNSISSGLGLVVVKELVNLLDGNLQYKSILNEGTTFSFSIEIVIPAIISNNQSHNSIITREALYFPKLDFSEKDSINSNNLTSSNDKFYIIIVDDEVVTRKSTIRLIMNVASDLNILECEDGTECLYTFYDCMKKGLRLLFIISDETMNLINGSRCGYILNQTEKERNIKHTPYFILTAYDRLNFETGVDTIYNKPLKKSDIQEIILYSRNC